MKVTKPLWMILPLALACATPKSDVNAGSKPTNVPSEAPSSTPMPVAVSPVEAPSKPHPAPSGPAHEIHYLTPSHVFELVYPDMFEPLPPLEDGSGQAFVVGEHAKMAVSEGMLTQGPVDDVDAFFAAAVAKHQGISTKTRLEDGFVITGQAKGRFYQSRGLLLTRARGAVPRGVFVLLTVEYDATSKSSMDDVAKRIVSSLQRTDVTSL